MFETRLEHDLPSCVLLDLDNTLYAYEPAHQAGLLAAQLAAEQTLKIKPRDFYNAVEDARAELKRRLGPTASSHHRLLYFQRAIELCGLASQVASALQFTNAYWTGFLKASELFPEVHEFLDDLRLLGVPVIILTDLTAEIQFRKFLYWRLDRQIDWIVTSEEAGADKPDPRMFRLALAKLGGIEGTVWMIGDNPVADIRGAKESIGAVTFQVLASGIAKCDEADHHIENFAQLRAHLRACRH